jgi:hypothetical protein
MPYAYAVSTAVEGDDVAMIEDAKSFEIGDNNMVTFYSDTIQRGREVTFFNWDNVTQITPLSEKEYDEITEMMP